MEHRGTSRKNESKLLGYLSKSKDGMKRLLTVIENKETLKTKKIGRPKRIEPRPQRSAAKRTLPGEERYPITMKTKDIKLMKAIAVKKNVKIKDVFTQAVSRYIESFEKEGNIQNNS